LSQLDANFAVTPTFANTAANVSNAAQPNITSVGTLIALSVTGNVVSGNLNTPGLMSATGNITGSNVNTGGLVSAYGTVTGGAFTTVGNIGGNNISIGNLIHANGNVTANNVIATGIISATGNVSTQGDAYVQGLLSATGNISTAQFFVGNFRGNIVGNVSVAGSNTQVLFNLNGNVGAAGGLTYNSGSNTLGILGIVSAQGNVTGGNLLVNGITQLVGTATAPTAPLNTANNQVATTAFVSNQINDQIGALGTMSVQNANNVSITGGTITDIPSVALQGGWSITPYGTKLYFSYNGTNVATLDSSGNFTAKGNVTAFGTM